MARADQLFFRGGGQTFREAAKVEGTASRSGATCVKNAKIAFLRKNVDKCCFYRYRKNYRAEGSRNFEFLTRQRVQIK